MMRKIVLSVTIVLLCVPALSYAQRTTATIRGTVRDTTQAVLPGVTVTATNEDTGLVRAVVTNYIRRLLRTGSADRTLQDRSRAFGLQESVAHGDHPARRRRVRG